MTLLRKVPVKRLLPVLLILVLALVQGWFGHGDASAGGGGCEPFTGDPSRPMTELLKAAPPSSPVSATRDAVRPQASR